MRGGRSWKELTIREEGEGRGKAEGGGRKGTGTGEETKGVKGKLKMENGGDSET